MYVVLYLWLKLRETHLEIFKDDSVKRCLCRVIYVNNENIKPRMLPCGTADKTGKSEYAC